MSEAIRQSDYDGVYYDRQSNNFLIVDVRDEEIALIGAFTGQEYNTIDRAEFEPVPLGLSQVSPEVVRDPAETCEQLVHEAVGAVNGGSTSFSYFEPVDVDFALRATNFSYDKDAPYLDRN